MDTFKLFRWRSRVKSGAPEVAGGAVETLASHVSDENAHPDYLKKGASVPTGQEKSQIAKHLADKLSHVWNMVRRDELLRTKEQFTLAKEHDLAQDSDNFLKASESIDPHVVTAYVLGAILKDYVDISKIKEMVRHHYQEAVGDGSQLLYVHGSTDDAEDGFVHLSTKTIGSATGDTFRPVYLKSGVVTAADSSIGTSVKPIYMDAGVLKASTSTVGSGTKPVYLNNGTITEFSATVGSTTKPVYVNNGVLSPISHDVVLVETDQTIKGTKIFVNTPRISDTTGDPSLDVDLVNLGYLKKAAFKFPVGSLYCNNDSSVDPKDSLGYGTWEIAAELGNFGFAWVRKS